MTTQVILISAFLAIKTAVTVACGVALLADMGVI